MRYIVTGTSRGLGFCLAKELVNHGQVLGVSRSIGAASALSSMENFSHFSLDLSIDWSSELFQTVSTYLDEFVRDDQFALILNAASFYSGFERLDQSALRELFNINFFSSFRLVNWAKDLNLRRVLIINSISGLIGQESQHEYSASKHALMGLARSLSKAAKNSNYDVMCINPGGIKTDLWSSVHDTDSSDFLCPESLAKVCLGLLLIPDRAFIENFVILPAVDV